MSIKKTAKRLFAAIVALVLSVAMVTPAFAADEKGTITIKNAVVGETYTIYRIADLESYSGDKYAYKANEDWKSFLEGSEYVNVNEAGYVAWVLEEGEKKPNAADVSAFVKDALDYAQSNSISSVDYTTAESTTVTFNSLDLGWYLVDSSLGALCSLNTTNPSAEVQEKNDEPSISKTVKEDSTGDYGSSATIDVVDTINYQLNVTIGTGVDGDYTITDILPSGITYKGDSVSITDWNLNDDYTVNWNATNNTLIIVLKASKLASAGPSVTINYAASVTGSLTSGTNYTNVVTLGYKSQTYKASASVVTWKIDGADDDSLFTKVDGDRQPLSGVKFVLQNSTTKKYATFEDGYLTGWVDNQDDATELETDVDGHIYAYGLDADTYILTETETLDGYNQLTDTITVVIAEDGTVTYKYTSSTSAADNNIVVVNEAGSLLPSTGGTGTTMLYVVGGALVVAAGVALVVRRRMSNEA